MKKSMKVVTLVLAVLMTAVLLCGCSNSSANPGLKGLYSHVGGNGALKDVYPPTTETACVICESIALCDDGTFTFCYDWIFDYASDGTSWYALAEATELYYGTYEVVSEDAELGETVIKITSVTGAKGADFDTSSADYADVDETLKATVEAKENLLTGMEFTLTPNGSMDGDYLFVKSFLAGQG